MRIICFRYNTIKRAILLITCTLTMAACHHTTKPVQEEAQPVGPAFSADSAYAYCARQCEFGPRTMNSTAHEQCGQWIAQQFESLGMTVTQQTATLTGWDGTPLRSTNIIARYRPQCTDRILLAAHWDARPWADNDADASHHHTPIDAADDGASGVAVMLELARLMATTDADSTARLPRSVGIDFVCFDAEDYGTPQWAEEASSEDTWALGAQHWAKEELRSGRRARYGILFDMVGGSGARFYREGYSMYYARPIVARVWEAARICGYADTFPNKDGGTVTDDHVPCNEVAGIPTIDIVPYWPDCPASSFGPRWHTVDDNISNISRETLKAVGQTIVQVLWSER